ncbi:MAG: RNA-binding cell elongation regulator Jag/EloR [bacterium]|jgi:spoIIIJ-associated protein|nr:RNA-binding cell elongation regulator Jag/EloR [Bacillota bacterium]HHW54976.1 protein jag [Bacillota bacterium]
MKTIETTGRTVEEAVEAGMAALGVEDKAEIEYEVLEESNRGFLGLLGGRPARVKVWVKETPLVKVCRLLEEIMEKMGVSGELEIEELGEYIQINITGKDLGILIGRRGRTLDALQYLVNLAANKGTRERERIILDVCSYRKRRAETLKNLARRLCQRVRRQRRSVVLEPMTPQERRVIHLAVQEERGVVSYSEGVEPFRKVIIAPKND